MSREARVRTVLYEGYFNFLVKSPHHLPVKSQDYLSMPGQITLFNLPSVDTTYFEDFDEDQDWQRGGENEDWGITTFDNRSCLTESVTGDYPTEADVWLQLNEIALLNEKRSSMIIVHRPYCEPGYDYQEISWWTNPEQVYSKRYTQLRKDWDTLYVSLDSLEHARLSVRFNVVSDRAIGEDGWLIDRVAVHRALDPDFIPEEGNIPREFSLNSFPNPFNSGTTINFNIPTASNISLEVYNLLGQKVITLFEGYQMAGNHTTNFTANNLSSGLFFVRLSTDNQSSTQKVMLIK
jgi:hypothetical protein